MLTALILLAGATILGNMVQAATPNPAPKKPFTVRDSIAMRKVVNSRGEFSSKQSGTFAVFAPYGRRFIVRTIRGDLEHDENIEQILLFETSHVRATLQPHSSTAPTPPTVVLERRFHDDWAQIDQLRWLDDSRIAFVAPGENGRMQGFVLDVDSRRLEQVTSSSTDVAAFAVRGDRVVYYARQPTTPMNDLVVPIGQRSIGELLPLLTTDQRFYPVVLFSDSVTSHHPVRINAPVGRLLTMDIWIAPDGQHAITLVPAVGAPMHWREYQVWDNERRGWTSDWVASDPLSSNLLDRFRFQLLDLAAGTARPLFDAPDGTLTMTHTKDVVYWVDSLHAIVVNTYLPLNDETVSFKEGRKRREGPAIAEVNVRTGSARPIMWLPFATAAQWNLGKYEAEVVETDWDSKRAVLTLKKALRGRPTGIERWHRGKDQWHRLTTSDTTPELPVVDVRESSNERPKLYATGGQCGCTQVLFDPAPEADEFTFGHEEILRWRDSRQRQWVGALIYPVDYKAGERYPFVLQTHGYYENEFVLDGPHGATTAFAAQALANAGFVVVQAGENPAAIAEKDKEGQNVADGWRSLIEKLDETGLIDRRRVGIIGFSRTGYYVVNMLAEHPDLVAAATVADAVQYNFSSYLLLANLDFKLANDDFDQITGGSPFKNGYGSWMEANPFYRMQKSNTALRVEAIGGPAGLVGTWETFAIRALAGYPTDLVYFPRGSHVLMKPSERLGSQGGNVDWFQFWLQGHEDSDPSKVEQYKRWQKLRMRRQM